MAKNKLLESEEKTITFLLSVESVKCSEPVSKKLHTGEKEKQSYNLCF